jgi:hypothetical protein
MEGQEMGSVLFGRRDFFNVAFHAFFKKFAATVPRKHQNKPDIPAEDVVYGEQRSVLTVTSQLRTPVSDQEWAA